jgi:hypothetical protein
MPIVYSIIFISRFTDGDATIYQIAKVTELRINIILKKYHNIYIDDELYILSLCTTRYNKNTLLRLRDLAIKVSISIYF